MKKVTAVVFILFSFFVSRAEKINGPANVRSAPNGEIILSIYDSVEVDCGPLDGDWFPISIEFKVNSDTPKFKKGDELMDSNGKVIGEWLSDPPYENIMISWYGNPKKYHALIFGHTHKANIYENSIVENVLLKFLTEHKNNWKKDIFKPFLSAFQFKPMAFLGSSYPNFDEQAVHESVTEDISPLDRLRLIFENNDLIGIVHTRELNVEGFKNYELQRGRKLLLIKPPKDKTLQHFIQKNKEAYDGID